MKFKQAFTLAEVMIFLVIVTVILSAMLITTKPIQALNNKNTKYKYASAYDALNLALYELKLKDNTNPFVFPEDNTIEGFKKLCNGLADYINVESKNCNASPISSNIAYMKDENTDFRNIQPHLVSLTGMKFYISELITDNKMPQDTRSYYNRGNPDYTLKFYMIYVDLNGDDNPKKPHTIKYNPSSKTNPYVFAFAAIPIGDAVPIGIAEYNIKYLAARIEYKENKNIYFSQFYSYREAKHAAWNWYRPGNANTQFKDKISFTYNDYIKEILMRNHTELYKFNQTDEFPEIFSDSMFAKCVPPSGTLLTPLDMCGIIVDTPYFGATD